MFSSERIKVVSKATTSVTISVISMTKTIFLYQAQFFLMIPDLHLMAEIFKYKHILRTYTTHECHITFEK